MEIKTYTADDVIKLTRVKAWKRIEGPLSLWDHLHIALSPENQAKIKFAPMPEMVVFENKPGKKYEGWRTKGTDWTSVFALTPDDNVVAIIEYKHGVEEVLVNLPSGTFRPGEDPTETMRRELMEETGFTAKNIEPLGDAKKGIAISGRKATTRYFGFLATGLEKTSEPSLEEDEDIETAYIPLTEWIKMIDRGMIREASAVTTTFMALRKLGKL